MSAYEEMEEVMAILHESAEKMMTMSKEFDKGPEYKLTIEDIAMRDTTKALSAGNGGLPLYKTTGEAQAVLAREFIALKQEVRRLLKIVEERHE